MISATGNKLKTIASTRWRALSDSEHEMMPLDIAAPRTEILKKQLATPDSIDQRINEINTKIEEVKARKEEKERVFNLIQRINYNDEFKGQMETARLNNIHRSNTLLNTYDRFKKQLFLLKEIKEKQANLKPYEQNLPTEGIIASIDLMESQIQLEDLEDKIWHCDTKCLVTHFKRRALYCNNRDVLQQLKHVDTLF